MKHKLDDSHLEAQIQRRPQPNASVTTRVSVIFTDEPGPCQTAWCVTAHLQDHFCIKIESCEVWREAVSDLNSTRFKCDPAWETLRSFLQELWTVVEWSDFKLEVITEVIWKEKTHLFNIFAVITPECHESVGLDCLMRVVSLTYCVSLFPLSAVVNKQFSVLNRTQSFLQIRVI